MLLKESRHEYVFEQESRFQSCHASTLTISSEGDILVSWFGGSEEGAEDVAIWLTRWKDGVEWQRPVMIAGQKDLPHWNPVLFRDEEGTIHLFYKVGPSPRDWWTMLTSSRDGGETWSAPQILVPGDRQGRGPVRNKPIILSDGTWAAPASVEGKLWDAFVDLSDDGGRTGQKSGPVPLPEHRELEQSPEPPPVSEESFRGRGVIQPTLWESSPGNVHMLLRSTAGKIYRSDSDDGGRTWSTAYTTELPNNNSGIDLTRLPDGGLVLAYNPVAENWGPRTPLVLSLSTDNGVSWKDMHTLAEGDGEFSYPAIISRGERILTTYTWKRERIAFHELRMEDE